jgi:uroporphyrinogen-III decarboxylase
MATLTKRERVMRTIRFEETDRVPVYDILQNNAVIEHYGGEALTVDNGARVKGMAIGRALDLTRMPEGPQQPHVERWENGLVLRHEPWTSWIIERPFRDVAGLAEWVKGEIQRTNALVYDRAYAERFHQGIRDCQAIYAGGDPTGRNDPTIMIVESGAGLTEAYWMADTEMFAYLLADEPDLVDEWLEARNQAELRRVAAIADPDIIPLALTYDDIAYKNAPLFSPAWLRRLWVPRLKRLVEAWHARDTVCIFHSDGNLWPVLDDLIGVGIDGLNPLEVLAGMTVSTVRARYPQLVLTGGIDVSQLLVYGTPDQIRAACREAIAATDGRGYFLGSSTELHWEVPLANAMAMFEFVSETPVKV